MTLYYNSDNEVSNQIAFSVNAPNVTGDCELQLTSDYSKKILTVTLFIVETNDRYTSFAMDYDPAIANADYTGFWQYVITNETSTIDQGLLKFINNEVESLKNEPKHQQSTDNGGGYVIY